MIGARLLREPSPSTAILVRFSAFVVALVSVMVIPFAFAAASLGHASVPAAFGIAALAIAVTLAATLAARSLDPLKR